MGSNSVIGSLLAVIAIAFAAFGEAQQESPREASPPGRLIDFDHRKVHLFCEGTGAPLVVIEAGGSSPARIWRGVQDKIALTTRVCAYDRAGYGWSDPSKKPRSIQDRADELDAVLKTAGEKGPYVLLAHSFGGFIARSFTQKNRREVAGMVLVDSVEEGQFFAPAAVKRWDVLDSMVREMRAKAPPERNRFFDEILDEIASNRIVPTKMRKIGGFGRLGDIPLRVIAHAKPFEGVDASLEPGWRAGQERLARLSTRSKLIIADNSDHNIQFSQPDLIVDAVADVVAEVQEGTRKRGAVQ